MKISDIVKVIDARIITGSDRKDLDISCAAASEMLSVVIARGCSDMLLITGQTGRQSINVCSLSETPALVVVRGLDISPEMKKCAIEKGIVIIKSPLTLYETCGRLFQAGLPGVVL